MKLKQSETIFINRSEIKFAAYNPRKKDPKVVESLKKNFKKVGFMGGIIWNKTTGNLVGGHKRIEAMDLIHNYNGENEYQIKVEAVELDEKTEKEQNIYLNSKSQQGKDDLELMAVLIEEIDIEAAGIEESYIEIIEAVVPNVSFGSNSEILDDIKGVKKSFEERKAEMKQLKKDIRQSVGEGQRESHFTVQFKTYDEKADFLESIGINGDDIFINGQTFIKRLDS